MKYQFFKEKKNVFNNFGIPTVKNDVEFLTTFSGGNSMQDIRSVTSVLVPLLHHDFRLGLPRKLINALFFLF